MIRGRTDFENRQVQMTRDQREIHRKKRILEYAERIGNVREKLGLDLHLAYMDLGGLPSSLLYASLTN